MMLRFAAIAAAALPLAACVSFGAEPPPQLMTLTAATPLAAGSDRAVDPARSVQIAVPSVPQAIATVRVPVQASATGLAYLKNAQWSEPPSRLFRNLLSEVVAQRTGRPVLDARQFSATPAVRLSGGLKAFGLDAATGSVVVIYDATLTRADATIPQARRFEARVPVSVQDAANVAPALNQAANQVAAEVSDWIGA